MTTTNGISWRMALSATLNHCRRSTGGYNMQHHVLMQVSCLLLHPLTWAALTLAHLHYTLAPFLLCALSNAGLLPLIHSVLELDESTCVLRRRVKVVHVLPGESEPDDCDYWWSQEHDRRFFTFIDKYPEGSQPDFVNHLSAGHRVRLHTSSAHLTGLMLQMPDVSKLEMSSALWQDVVCLACSKAKHVKGCTVQSHAKSFSQNLTS